MGCVTVSRIVEIKSLGFRRLENLKEVMGQGAAPGTADFGAGVAELKDGGVATQASGLSLFFPAGFDEFLGGKFFKGAGAGGAGAIGGDYAGKAEIFLIPAGADAGESHDFQVIRVGSDSQVSGGGQGGGEVASGGNK